MPTFEELRAEADAKIGPMPHPKWDTHRPRSQDGDGVLSGESSSDEKSEDDRS
jgi:hypothetical protein